jgi:hypothetical protein
MTKRVVGKVSKILKRAEGEESRTWVRSRRHLYRLTSSQQAHSLPNRQHGEAEDHAGRSSPTKFSKRYISRERGSWQREKGLQAGHE